MDKLLPVIELEKPACETEETEEPDKSNHIPERDDKGNMEIIDEIMSNKEPNDDIITIEEREIPDEDEVFKERTPQKISPVLEEPHQVHRPEGGEFPPEGKRTKRKYVRKAPMSDKQKAHLAKMREIASEKRRLERERKAKEKEEALVAKAEKKILEKKKKEEAEQEEELKKQRAEQDKINNHLTSFTATPERVNGFTKEDLDNAVLSAISQYDTLRKQQKKEKREAERKRAEEEKMRATLARAINPQQPTNDPWRGFFT